MAPESLAEAIRRHGLDARKPLGQHFLLDAGTLSQIAELAGDMSGRQVVEVGAGPGGLTRALLRTTAAHIHAVEVDERAWPLLDELVQHASGRLSLIRADATAVDVASLCPAPRKLVANLPYNVGTPLLIGWLREAAKWERMTLMFQLEVAERICAAPSSSDYGRLAVLAQWCAHCSIVMRLPPAAFSPPPSVESAVVDILPKPESEQPSASLFRAMEHVTGLAFGQRRKMLRNSLRPIGGETLLQQAAISPTRRAETLSVQEFARLAQLLQERNNSSNAEIDAKPDASKVKPTNR